MLQGQSAAGAHLGLITRGQSNIQTSLEEFALHRAQHHRLLQVGTQVHAGTQRCGIGRQLLMAAVHNFYLYHSFLFFLHAKIYIISNLHKNPTMFYEK